MGSIPTQVGTEGCFPEKDLRTCSYTSAMVIDHVASNIITWLQTSLKYD